MNIAPYAAVLSAALLAPIGAAQNLLTNPGFEADFTGWFTFGNAFTESASPPEFVPHSGSKLGKLFGNFSGGFNVSGIGQSFPASPGQTFTIDAWSRHWSGDPMIGSGAPNDNWAVMKMAFFDAANVEIGSAEGTILDGNSPTNIWIDNAAVTGSAPPGTVRVEALILYLQPVFDGGAVQFDDVEFFTCAQAATASQFGVSTGSFANGPAQLASTAPVIGTTASLQLTHANPYTVSGALLISLGATTTLFDCLALYVDFGPTLGVLPLTVFAGSGSIPISIPYDARQCTGIPIYFQIIVQTFPAPTDSICLPLQATNGLQWVIGHS